MTYIEIILNNCLYLLCPIALYLLYIMYQKNLDQEQTSMTLEIAIISALYFLLRYGSSVNDGIPTMLYDIPLLLCYMKKKTGFSLLISLILITYQTAFLHFNIVLLVLEYLVYFLVYICLSKKEITPLKMINYFIVVKSFILSVEVFWFINPLNSWDQNITYLLCITLILYCVSNLILYFFDQGEKIVALNTDLCKIEKEKELRTSLFKVTHEIKNPIAVCKGYLDMMDLNDKKKVFKYIPIIKSEINRTLILMDDFLDYTKIKIEKEEVDLTMLLEEIEDSLAPLFNENNMKAEFVIPDEEVYLEADYNRLKQVFINVLKNAIEARDTKKIDNYVTVTLEVLKKKREVVISVKDNGIGMNKETLSKVSQMFFTTKEKGTGLGTCLSKEIMELHGGGMSFQSKEQEGTDVILTLPLNLEIL